MSKDSAARPASAASPTTASALRISENTRRMSEDNCAPIFICRSEALAGRQDRPQRLYRKDQASGRRVGSKLANVHPAACGEVGVISALGLPAPDQARRHFEPLRLPQLVAGHLDRAGARPDQG